MSNQLVRINSNQKAVEFIMEAAGNVNADIKHRQNPILSVVLDRFVELSKVAPDIRSKHMEMHALRQRQANKASKRLAQLRKLVSGFRIVLRVRNGLMEREDWANSFYKFSYQSGPGHSAKSLLVQARDLIKGDANAVKHGLPAMASPSAEDLQAAVNDLESQRNRKQNMEDRYRESSAAMAGLYEEALELHRVLASVLRMHHCHDSDAVCREAMRKYGFEFKEGGSDASSSDSGKGGIPVPSDPEPEPDFPEPQGDGEEGEGDDEPADEPADEGGEADGNGSGDVSPNPEPEANEPESQAVGLDDFGYEPLEQVDLKLPSSLPDRPEKLRFADNSS